MFLRHLERLLIGCLFAAGSLLAQQQPRPGDVHAFTVPLPDGASARAHGLSHRGHLENGRYPLVIVLCDRAAAAAAATLRALPGDVIDRSQMIVVAPELSEIDASDFTRLQELVVATVEAAGKKWSVHPERVVLLGIGRGASRALALARAAPPCCHAVLALAPDDAWLPANGLATEPVEIPALAVAGGKARRFADALRDAHGKALPIQVSERQDADRTRPATLLQPALEWFAAQLAPPPKGDKERIHGRTTAAAGSKQRVVAIAGEYDTVEDVLAGLEIPHLKMTWSELAKFDLAETDVLLINCSGGAAYGEVRARVNKKLRRFVVDGGYLFTTDWSLRWPLSEVFADHVADLDPGIDEDFVVDVQPTATSGNHELLQNVFPLDQPLPRWQIDASSFLVEPRQGLEVLLQSKELGVRHKGNDMLGVCFRVGAYGGRVLNIVSHFAHQGDGNPTTPMFQLIVNFVNAAKRQRASKR